MKAKTQLRHFIVTYQHRERLADVIQEARQRRTAGADLLDALEEKLESAQCVTPAALPDDVVIMQSRFRVRDLGTGELETLVLTYPNANGTRDGDVSVLSPIGCAVLGCSTGDEIEAKVPSGVRRIRLLDVFY